MIATCFSSNTLPVSDSMDRTLPESKRNARNRTAKHVLGSKIVPKMYKCTCCQQVHARGGAEHSARLALFVYLNQPTKNDVTSGKKER